MEKQKQIQKKKLNKKLVLPLLVLLSIGLVLAMGYYAVFSATINFTQPISTSGNPTSNVIFPDDTFTAFGNPITVSNAGTTEKTIVISNDNGNPNVTVSYVGQLAMTQKVVTPGVDQWKAIGVPVTINYTMVGNTFKVSGVPTGYVAVYYPNVGSYDTYTGAVVLANGITTNLPVSNDLNGGSSSNYTTNGFNLGTTQNVGAKIWLVPTSAVTGSVINWNQASNFYFETALIQFNTAGNIVISPGSSVTFTPMFTVDEYSPTITGLTITTTVK